MENEFAASVNALVDRRDERAYFGLGYIDGEQLLTRTKVTFRPSPEPLPKGEGESYRSGFGITAH